MRAPIESFSDEERAALAPHFTNLDRPVFALVDLPETVKGALFARYSRYGGTLRRLFLDEFAGDVEGGAARARDAPGGERAAALYERVFLGYGDDSVAQLGGAHLAFEWVSNVVTKLLQRGRLAAYLEQSTRYIPYDAQMPGGGYRYWRDAALGPVVAGGPGRQRVRELVEEEPPQRPRIAAVAGEQRPLHRLREVDQPEHRPVQVRDMRRDPSPLGVCQVVGRVAHGRATLARPPVGLRWLTRAKACSPPFVVRGRRRSRRSLRSAGGSRASVRYRPRARVQGGRRARACETRW